MSRFRQQRHKPAEELRRPRELVVACPPMRSNVNLSRIVRTAGCCGVGRIICCGNFKLIPRIAREAQIQLEIETHRSLPPVLKNLRKESYRLVALEQTTQSGSLFDFRFERRTVLVVGNERLGVEEALLGLVDDAVEIPVYGRPFSHNVATAVAMALYEYCRQFPSG